MVEQLHPLHSVVYRFRCVAVGLMRRRKCPLQSAIVVVIGDRTKLLMKKYVVVRKIEKVVVVSVSRRLQKTEQQDFQLGVVM